MEKAVILVADDDPMNLYLIRNTLEDRYDVIFAESGPETLEKTSLFQPDLILLDVMMPGMDGYAVCRQLKADEKTREIPVIFVTGKGEVVDEVTGFDAGAVDYIAKPINPPIVRKRVVNHLELKQARETLAKQNRELIEAARLQEDLEKMNRHDIKTPLNIIIGYSELIRTAGIPLPEKTVHHLKTIEKSGYQILDMINRTLDLFKMERGMYRWNPEPVNILQTFDKIINGTRHLALKKDVSIKMQVEGREPEAGDVFLIYGEDLLCYSMLANLIQNAIEASPEGEHISIMLDEEKNEAFIRIHNYGAVPHDVRNHFFEKYVTSGKNKGTGFGTYSAKLIAETQKGRIDMSSSYDEGTTITIALQKPPVHP